MSTQKQKFYRAARFLASAAIVVLVMGLIMSWMQYRAAKTAPASPPAGASSEPRPNTKKPSADEFKNHRVAPDEPRYIFIPKLSVKAMIKPVGVTTAHQIASPRNVHEVGWYTGSPKPAQPGAMILDGHVSSWEAKGVFYDLENLKPDDTMTVERGDAATLTYRVVRIQVYDVNAVDMRAVLKPVTPNKPGLNLISCTGKVIKGTNDFDKRIVVFAEQI